MIRLLPVAAVYVVANLFQLRYSGESVEDIATWRSIIMIFLAKIVHPTKMQHFRGIGLLSVMSKWYMQCLFVLAVRKPKPAFFHNICIYAYEQCLGTNHITVVLQLLLSRGWEWQNRCPVFIFNGDILAAFDNMRPDAVVAGLRAGGLHPRVIAAMLAETVNLSCYPEFDGIGLDKPVSFNKCAKQGGVESSFEWNQLMFNCLVVLDPLWKASGYGINLDGRLWTHAVWADNVWLFANSAEHLTLMIRRLTDVFNSWCLNWKLDSLCYMVSSADAEHGDLQVLCNDVIYAIPRVDSMPVLGCLFDRKGDTTVALNHRIAKAEKAYWADKIAMKSKSLALHLRLRRYSERVVPRVLHGCGSWAWSRGVCQQLAVWENKILRWIVGFARQTDECWLKWFRRTTKNAKRLYSKYGFTSLTTRVLREIHRTAGMLRQPDAERFHGSNSTVILLSEAIQWRDTWWWHQQQCVMTGSGSGEWRHASNFGTRGKVWDGPFVSYYGHEWHREARKDTWASTFEEFAKRAYCDVQSIFPESKVRCDAVQHGPSDKPPREVVDVPVTWRLQLPNTPATAVEFLGDSELVIGWVNGIALPRARNYSVRCEQIVNTVAREWQTGSIATREAVADWFRHVYREFNCRADSLANMAMDNHASEVHCCAPLASKPVYVRAWFDGGKRRESNLCACGWHVEGAWGTDASSEPSWRQLAHGSILLHPESTVVDAELQGLEQLVAAVVAIIRDGHICFDNYRVCVDPQQYRVV